MKLNKKSNEVWIVEDDVAQVSRKEVLVLKPNAGASPRKRARLCAHRDSSDLLHEMFIVLHRDTYVRPHKHAAKSESFHMVQGAVDVILFDDAGNIQQIVALSDFASGEPFYYRLNIPAYHTVLPRTEYALFHETTNGPFRQGDTLFPDWAPPDDQPHEAALYIASLRARLKERNVA